MVSKRPQDEADPSADEPDPSEGAGVAPRTPVISSDFASRLNESYGGQILEDGAKTVATPPQGQTDHDSAIANEIANWHRGESYRRYRIEGEIGRGGMGAIFKAWDTDLRRTLAMKVILSPDHRKSTEEDTVEFKRRLLSRFLEEAQITGQLEHPGIVPVHELGIDESGQVYFTMRLVKGRTLDEVIELAHDDSTEWSPTRVLGVLLRVCETMAYAHSRGVLHRDLKPANIMVGQFGETYVMDWGVAKIDGGSVASQRGSSPPDPATDIVTTRRERSSPDRTQAGSLIGTLCFMSLEQARGNVEPQSDVYSVGCMLYYLCTNTRPYVDPDSPTAASQVIAKLFNGPPTPMLEVRSGIAPELVAICEKAMAWKLEDRYPTMSELADDMRAYLEDRVVHAYESGAFAEFKKYVLRNKATAAALAGLIVLTLASLLAFAWLERGKVQVLEAAKRQNYLANIAAAEISLQRREVGAKDYLLACDEDQRISWEWRHLFLRADSSIARLDHDPGARITRLAADAAGKLFVTGAEDGQIWLWDAIGRRHLRTLRGGPDPILAVRVFENARKVISVSGLDYGNLVLRIFDVATGEELRSVAYEKHAGRSVAISPDGSRLAYGTSEDAIRIVDTLTGKDRGTPLEGHEERVNAVAFSDDGKFLVSGSEDGEVLTWNLSTGATLQTVSADSSPIQCVTFSSSGSEFAAGSLNGSIHRWKRGADEALTIAGKHKGSICSIAYDPRNSHIASGSIDNSIAIHDLATGESRTVLGHRKPVRSVLFVAGDSGRLVTGSDDGSVRIWDTHRAGAVSIHHDHSERIKSIAVSPDGSRLAFGLAGANHVQVRDVKSDSVITLATMEDDTVNSIAFDSTGKTLAAGMHDAGNVRVWNIADGTFVDLDDHDASVAGIAFVSNSRRLISAADTSVFLWDLDAPASPKVLRDRHTSAINCVAVSPDGNWIASAGADKIIVMWDLRTGEPVRDLSGHLDSVSSVAFSPDGDRIVSGSNDRQIKIWSVTTGECLMTLSGHEDQVRAVGFNTKGDRILSGSFDRTVRLWNAATGVPLLALRGHDAPITAIAHADGWIASASFATTSYCVWRAQGINPPK